MVEMPGMRGRQYDLRIGSGGPHLAADLFLWLIQASAAAFVAALENPDRKAHERCSRTVFR
jgi:hypothetical protein